MQQRQKTSEELAQERADEEFARKLHAEMMAEEQQQAEARAVVLQQQQNNVSPHQNYHPSQQPSSSPSASSPTPTGASGRITCQFCQSQNNVPSGVGTNQFLCGYCKRILIFNQGPDVIQQQQMRHQQQQQHIVNHSSNNNDNYPAVNGGGGGRSVGGAPQQQNNIIDNNQPIFQGNVPPPVNIQVRCGQCSVVNAVPRPKNGNTLQFMCGSCQSVNEVNC